MQRTGVTQYVTPSSSTNGSGNTGMAQFGLEKYTFFFFSFLNFINPLQEIYVMLLGYSYSNHKSSTTHSYPCEQYCYVSIISV